MFVVRSSFYNSTSLPRNVQVCMTDILIQIVDEVGVSGQEVVELIFEQFIKHEKVI
jgi:sister-chromatid-cohesion protein PDS5